MAFASLETHSLDGFCQPRCSLDKASMLSIDATSMLASMRPRCSLDR
jgi:hypothetical protein